MKTRKAKTTAKPKRHTKKPKKQKLALTVSGDEIRFFLSVPTKSELKKLRRKGISTEAGLITLSESMSGEEENTWVGPSSVMAMVNGKEIPIHCKNNKPTTVRDYRGKDVVYVEHTVDGAEYTAEVVVTSADEVRVELALSEQWLLPDGRSVEIYSLEVVSPSGVGLEYQGGGGGYCEGELITADGTATGLDEEADDDTGEYRVTVSASGIE
jgi:hypothetical protein